MPTAPAALYLALFNGDPKGAGSEVTTTIRAAGRITVTVTAPADDGVTNTMASAADADFGAADAGATVTHVAVYDAATSGNRLASKSVGTNAIDAGQDVKIAAGDLTFTIGS